MKKAFTIVLLALFLFNVGGYYVVFWGLRNQADNELTVRLENNSYQQEETTLLKIPMSLPYPIQDENYQFVKGRFEHQGEYYKLVKQKLDGDTLCVVCIKDTKTKQLVKKMIDFGNLSNDLPTQSKESQNLLSKLIKEYESLQSISILENNGWVQNVSFPSLSFNLTTIDQSVQSPPPKHVS